MLSTLVLLLEMLRKSIVYLGSKHSSKNFVSKAVKFSPRTQRFSHSGCVEWDPCLSCSATRGNLMACLYQAGEGEIRLRSWCGESKAMCVSMSKLLVTKFGLLTCQILSVCLS